MLTICHSQKNLMYMLLGTTTFMTSNKSKRAILLNFILLFHFRTVWYELLCGEWPFKGLPPEAVIWQVGKGIKQTLANLQASRDVKVCIFIFILTLNDISIIVGLFICFSGYINVMLVIQGRRKA